MYDKLNSLVTVIGGGGFIGRYVCENLFKTGVRVRVVQRQPRRAFFLQPLAAVGQLDLHSADVTSPESLEDAFQGSSAVVNLVGILNGDFDKVHVAGARAAAQAAANAGATAFIHVSAIGADAKSEADYARTKGEGEAAVRATFPDAIIFRPSLVFGPEDQFTNRFARLMTLLPFYPVIAPNTRFQPVYVHDLAEAIAAAAMDPGRHAGKTYEIGGPEVMTMRELSAAIARHSGQHPEFVDLPDFAANMISYFGFLPGAPLTRDQWRMLQHDNVCAKKARGLDAFGITPTPLAAVAPDWLARFRHGGRFAARREYSSVG